MDFKILDDWGGNKSENNVQNIPASIVSNFLYI